MNPAIARILDANFNRAREALRVMEDYVRFALDDENLAQRLKGIRHGLADALKAVDPLALIAARDTANDVGTANSTESEYQRSDAESVVVAAGKRLGEALRVIEEYAKTIDKNIARRVETLRYAGYEIEKELRLLMHAREQFCDVRLYVLITEAMCVLPWKDVIGRVTQAVGRCCFQLREKDLSDGALLERADEFTKCCRMEGAISIINDRPDVAVISNANGVHVGQDDLSIQAVRKITGPHKIIGISTHTKAQAMVALKSNPDYVAVGPMFPTDLKPHTDVATPSVLREVASLAPIPKVAIGGIEASNVSQVFEAGADCVAVCSAIAMSEDPGAAAKALLQWDTENSQAST